MKFTIKEKIILITIFIAMSLYLYNVGMNHKKELAMKDIEISNIKITTDSLIESYKKPTLIEIIKEQIDDNNHDIKLYGKLAEKSKKIHEASIWYGRCLEIEGQLELKGSEHNLVCNKYYISTTGLISEKYYIELQKFDTFNIENTKIDLGL